MRHLRPASTLLLLPAVILFSSAAGAETFSAGDTQVSAKRTLNADGTTSMVYSTALSDLATEVGLALSTPATSVAPQLVSGTETVSGNVYAKVSLSELPDWLLWQKGAVNVALSPTAEESRAVTTFSRTWTVNDGLKATLADSYAVSRDAANASWSADKSLSVSVVETGTVLTVATRMSGDAARPVPSVSAQQSVLGGLSVTTSVSDTGSQVNRSITAGFSHRW